MPEYIAAACEGLRWAACEAFDLGPMTSAGMQFALSHFQFDGGILLGSTSQKPSAICMKVWGPGPRRMLGKSSFQPIEAILQNGLDRPARSYGPQHRLQAEKPYLAALAERFHGLRPLRFVVDSTSRPWGMYLEKLLQTTACRIIPCRVLPQEFSRQIAADNAHFGIRVSSDGENCMIFDEQGRQIERERLVDLLKTLDLGTSDVPTDALVTVAHFLQFLSRDDRPCSAVLDGTV
jgi:phosphomannomutase